MTNRGLRLFYSEDEGDSCNDGNKLALATCPPKCEDLKSSTGERLSLDIGALKRQYARLRERQRQAHIILAAACARHAAVGVPSSPTSLTVNNLLLGKSAIVSNRGRRLGPLPGAIPPSRQTLQPNKIESQLRVRSSDAIIWKEDKSCIALNRCNSVKWKDIKKEQLEKCRKESIDLEKTGEGVIVFEITANQMIASMRSHSSSETSSYSSRSASSTDTSLCDDQDRGRDSEAELPDDNKENYKHRKESSLRTLPSLKESKIIHTPLKKESATLSPMAPPKMVSDISVTNISEYLNSSAEKPLITYIDGFESKLKNSLDVSSSDVSYKSTSTFIEIKFNDRFSVTTENESDKYEPFSSFKALSSYKQHVRESTESDIFQSLSKMTHDGISKSRDIIIKPLFFSNTKAFTDLSPINVLGCNYNLGNKSPYDFVFTSSFQCLSPAKPDTIKILPDVIDSLIIYPNFVPDVDLSDKNMCDIDSPPRSPGVESIIVSEDEPPIQLKIDKYFEHSPEFFGARITDPNTPSRRSTDRKSRLPKKLDSLNIQSSHNETLLRDQAERALSLTHSHSFTDEIYPVFYEEDNIFKPTETNEITKTKGSPLFRQATPNQLKDYSESIFEDYMLRSGRKNSERALEIIQENSKILSRISTKQNIIINMLPAKKTALESKTSEILCENQSTTIRKSENTELIDSPLIKELTSDSLEEYRKRLRLISIDDPFFLDTRNIALQEEESTFKTVKTPSIKCLENKTDVYGWENKGFQAKYNFKSTVLSKPERNFEFDYKSKTNEVSTHGEESNLDVKPGAISDWTRHSVSAESKTSLTLPSTEAKDASSYDRKRTTDNFNYPRSTRHNDYALSKSSDICSKTIEQGPKMCENLLKSELLFTQVSDFAHVTSSFSLSYVPSAEDDSQIGAKRNSSDTLCQITSLDQVSTPISPKIFPKETPTLPIEYAKK